MCDFLLVDPVLRASIFFRGYLFQVGEKGHPNKGRICFCVPCFHNTHTVGGLKVRFTVPESRYGPLECAWVSVWVEALKRVIRWSAGWVNFLLELMGA